MTSDTIRFSCVGYENVDIPVTKIKQQDRLHVVLIPHVTVLPVVSIESRKRKTKEYLFGNDDFKGGLLLTDTIHAGGSIALLVNNKGASHFEDFAFPAYPAFVKFRILKNNWPTFRFRLRILDVDSLGMPGKDLLTQALIVESDVRRGWCEADLSRYGLILDRPFFIALEYLLTDSERDKILKETRAFKREHPGRVTIDSVMINGKQSVREHWKWPDFPGVSLAVYPIAYNADTFTCYSRSSSFAPWEKIFAIPAMQIMLMRAGKD